MWDLWWKLISDLTARCFLQRQNRDGVLRQDGDGLVFSDRSLPRDHVGSRCGGGGGRILADAMRARDWVHRRDVKNIPRGNRYIWKNIAVLSHTINAREYHPLIDRNETQRTTSACRIHFRLNCIKPRWFLWSVAAPALPSIIISVSLFERLFVLIECEILLD